MMLMIAVQEAFKTSSVLEMRVNTIRRRCMCSGHNPSAKDIRKTVAVFGEFFDLSSDGKSVRLVPSVLRTRIIQANLLLLKAQASMLVESDDYLTEFTDLQQASTLINNFAVAMALPGYNHQILKRANLEACSPSPASRICERRCAPTSRTSTAMSPTKRPSVASCAASPNPSAGRC